MQATHKNDPNHPVILNLAGYPNSNVRNRRSGWHYPIVPNSGELPADVYSFDMYPLIYEKGGFTVAQWVDQIDRLDRYTFGLVPWYTFVEGGIQPCPDPPVCTGGHGPSAAQVTSEAWLAVIHGIKGISWWGPLAYIDVERKAAMGAFTSRINNLKDVILSTTTRTVSSDQISPHSRVDVMVRENAATIYVFAARLSDIGEENDPTIFAQLTISGLGDAVASVYGDGRTVPVATGTLTDRFAPFDVHIYEIPKLRPRPAPPRNLSVTEIK
jgi:hypothetical protein